MSTLARPAIRPLRALRYGAVLLAAFLFLVPLGVALLGSLKSTAEIATVLSLPSRPYVENYAIGWAQLSRSLFNSLAITIPAVILSVFVGCVAAFPLSLMSVKRSRIVYFFLLTGMFVPYQIVQIPLFFVMRTIGLYNTIPGLWLVHVAYGVPICTFFMRNFFATVPRSLYEAAQIDGCGPTGYFFKILLPASASGLAALAIVQSRSVWNDLLFAVTLTNSNETMPVTAKLNSFVGSIQVQYGPLMASTLISILPMLVAFLCFQRAFVRGLLGGSSK
jgi:glucose/mannose transport system permease protein